MRSIRWTSKAAAPTMAIVAALAASLLVTPSLAAAQDGGAAASAAAEAQPIGAVATDKIAAQLGAKLAHAQPADLVIGASATGILNDPARLAALGVRDAKAGSRVTILRSSRDRVRVEVDEFDPVPRTRRLALHLDVDGRVSVGSP